MISFCEEIVTYDIQDKVVYKLRICQYKKAVNCFLFKLSDHENHLYKFDKIFLEQGCPTQLHHGAKIFVSILKRAAQ